VIKVSEEFAISNMAEDSTRNLYQRRETLTIRGPEKFKPHVSFIVINLEINFAFIGFLW
jgi:hypothetical protein